MARGNALTGGMARILHSRAQNVANLLDEDLSVNDLDREWTRIERQLAKPEVVATIKQMARERIENPPERRQRRAG